MILHRIGVFLVVWVLSALVLMFLIESDDTPKGKDGRAESILFFTTLIALGAALL